MLTHVEVRGQPLVPFFKRHVSFETWSLIGARGLPVRLDNLSTSASPILRLQESFFIKILRIKFRPSY